MNNAKQVREAAREIYKGAHVTFTARALQKHLKERGLTFPPSTVGTTLWRMWQAGELVMVNYGPTYSLPYGIFPSGGKHRIYTFHKEA